MKKRGYNTEKNERETGKVKKEEGDSVIEKNSTGYATERREQTRRQKDRHGEWEYTGRQTGT